EEVEVEEKVEVVVVVVEVAEEVVMELLGLEVDQVGVGVEEDIKSPLHLSDDFSLHVISRNKLQSLSCASCMHGIII
ncbi:hypothetical protein VIGAN_08121800, partial [Vigna angularis var. angularis]